MPTGLRKHIKCYLRNFFIIFLLFSSSSLLMSSRSSWRPILALLKQKRMQLLYFQNQYYLKDLPRLFHHDGGELVVLHAPVVEVLVPIFSLVIPAHTFEYRSTLKSLSSPKYAPNLFADVNLGIAIVDEVIELRVVLLLTLALYPVLPTSASFASLGRTFKLFNTI